MFFRQLLNDETACASYLLGCKTHGTLAVIDPHSDLVDEYVAAAAAQGAAIVAVLETRVQADHVSGLPALVARTGATAYLPEGSGVEFDHHALAGEVLRLGNTALQAIATPGHAAAHHAYLATDHTRGEEPWFVLTGDALLVGDAGRPDLHAHGEQTVEAMARTLYRSLSDRLLSLPDHLLLYPAHESGSVCGRGLSANPAIVGIYRFWRDSGYVFGGLIAGGVADALGYNGAIACVAALTAASGLWVLFDMPPHDRAPASRRSRNERSAALPARSRARP